MSYIESFIKQFSEKLAEDVNANGWKMDNPEPKVIPVDPTTFQMSTLARDEALSLSSVNSLGAESVRKMERYVHENRRIAGKTLEEIIRLLPNVHYTTDQLVSFIYKHEPIVTKNEVKNDKATSNMLSFLRHRTKKNLTNQQLIEEATKHALLYGRAGLFRNGEDLEFYPHDQYTVVIGYRKNSTNVEPELFGYILYPEVTTTGVINLEEVPENVDVKWFIDSLNQPVNPTVYVAQERMRFVPASANNFVNLRYDLEMYNPESRLFKERLRIADSIALHEILNRKFKERGIGRMVIETKDVDAVGNSEQGVTDLINSSAGARRKDLGQIKEFNKYLADTVKNMDDDDVLVLPEGLTQKERLENTNTPEKFLDILLEDQNIVPLCYGIPPTLLGLGNLSDRNISIASINETTEDTAINNIRQTFYSQLGLLYGLDQSEELVNENLPDQTSVDVHNESISKIALNLFKAGYPQEKINKLISESLL